MSTSFWEYSWLIVCSVPSSGLAGWVGVSKDFAFTTGKRIGPPDTLTVHCVSLVRGWNCTSKVAVEVTNDYSDSTPS